MTRETHAVSDMEVEVPLSASADEIEQIARERLPETTYDAIASGAGDELTLRANRFGFDQFFLRPRVLVDVSAICTEQNILGTYLSAPIFVSPMSALQRVHPRGEAAMAAGAAAAGVGFILSTAASIGIDEVAREAGESRWFQLYFITRDRRLLADLVHKVAKAGFRAICVTVDAPVGALRRRVLKHQEGGRPDAEMHGPSSLQPSYAVVNDSVVSRFQPWASDPALTWTDIQWLRSITDLPILLKGIMTGEDARLAVDSGVQGIIVSNHGGRHLDHALGTIEALPEIVEAVQERIVIVLDGGVRRPTDIAIALALGASAVSIGRPAAWALAYGGSLGVASFLRNLSVGLARTMAEIGVTAVSGFRRSHVGRR